MVKKSGNPGSWNVPWMKTTYFYSVRWERGSPRRSKSKGGLSWICSSLREPVMMRVALFCTCWNDLRKESGTYTRMRFIAIVESGCYRCAYYSLARLTARFTPQSTLFFSIKISPWTLTLWWSQQASAQKHLNMKNLRPRNGHVVYIDGLPFTLS